MKIHCRNCNTKYDYDKHEGYCPTCGSFNEKPVVEKKEKREKRWEPGKGRKKVLWILVLIVILIPVIGLPTARLMTEQKYKGTRMQSVPCTEIQMEEAIELGGVQLKITGTQWHAYDTRNQFLQMEYALGDYPYEYGPRIYGNVDIYLCVDGVYVKQVEDPYGIYATLPQEDPYRKEMREDNYTGHLNEAQGSLAFLVPIEVEEAYILIVEYDGNVSETTVYPAIHKYRMPVEVTAS